MVELDVVERLGVVEDEQLDSELESLVGLDDRTERFGV